MGALRRHPFAVEGFFDWSLVLTYAVPKSILASFAGQGLELDSYGDHGFLAIALVQTRALRPRGMPAWLGRDFLLSGYGVFTRFVRPGKQTLRGLRILRSDADRASMVLLGNVFTHYGYRRAHLYVLRDAQSLAIHVRTPAREADLLVRADLTSVPAELPATSPFRTMADARSFAGSLPYTFSYDERAQRMMVIRELRTAWDPQPVSVVVDHATFFEKAPFAGADVRLANAFYAQNVPYSSKAGTLESLV